MRTFLAIVIIITMHHFKISDPTTPWIVQAMLFVGDYPLTTRKQQSRIRV